MTAGYSLDAVIWLWRRKELYYAVDGDSERQHWAQHVVELLEQLVP